MDKDSPCANAPKVNAKTKREEASPLSNPLVTFSDTARALHYTPRSFSVSLSRGQHQYLKNNITYVGSRPMFRLSVIEAYLASRTVSALSGQQV